MITIKFILFCMWIVVLALGMGATKAKGLFEWAVAFLFSFSSGVGAAYLLGLLG